MFATNFKELNDNIPEGIYEAAISQVEEDGTKIVVKLEIRKDIKQDCAGRTFTHWMYKLREPKELDLAVGGYSFNQLMRIGKAARLPEGKNYASLGEYLADLVGKAVQVELYYDLYKGKDYLKVKYWNESTAQPLTYRPVPPQSRQTQPTHQSVGSAPQQTPAAKLPWEQ